MKGFDDLDDNTYNCFNHGHKRYHEDCEDCIYELFLEGDSESFEKYYLFK